MHGVVTVDSNWTWQIEKPLSDLGDTVKYFEVMIVHLNPRGGGITVGLLQGNTRSKQPGMVLSPFLA